MENIKTKCRKCGYEITIPENTRRVICGACGTLNTHGKIASFLKKYDESAGSGKQGGFNTGQTKPPYKPVKTGTPAEPVEETPDEIDDAEFPENKSASRIITVILILAPFIGMAVEFFRIPRFAAVLFVLIIIIAVMFYVKRK